MADERFGSRPDLLVVDGGKPQLTAAIKQLEALGLDIPVCGLAKADEEVFVPWDETPVVLPTGSASLYLIKQVRDESHRFAITFHRELRDKAMTVSVLDDVPGVGPTRKRALMRHFGSMKRLRAASEQEIAEVRGVPKTKRASKQLIYMIGRFSIIYFAAITCRFRVLLTLKRLTSHGEQPCYPAG